jgi:hypothetical protein
MILLLYWRQCKRNSAAATGNYAKDERERFVAVLEIPPVDSAQKAVQVQIIKDVRANKK